MSSNRGESEVSAGYFIYTYSAGCCFLWQRQHFPMTEAAQALSCLYHSSSVMHAPHGKCEPLFFCLKIWISKWWVSVEAGGLNQYSWLHRWQPRQLANCGFCHIIWRAWKETEWERYGWWNGLLLIVLCRRYLIKIITFAVIKSGVPFLRTLFQVIKVRLWTQYTVSETLAAC